MAILNPYLNFQGNTEEAFEFYRSVFGGEFAMVQRFKDTPEAGKLSGEDLNKIMHIALPIGNGNVLMGTDAVEGMGHKLAMGNNFHLSISTESEEETKKIYDALSKGGNIVVPLSKQFWGALFGMFTDKFGISWMVNYDERRQG
jgi:PhnB protein